MSLVPVTIYGNVFTSHELAFLLSIADHTYTDGQLIIGNSSTSGVSFATLTQGSGVTITNGHGSITISATGITPTFVANEIVLGSGTAWTLANSPTLGTQQIYSEGQRLTPGAGNDYTISGSSITTVNSFSSGSILADYQH